MQKIWSDTSLIVYLSWRISRSSTKFWPLLNPKVLYSPLLRPTAGRCAFVISSNNNQAWGAASAEVIVTVNGKEKERNNRRDSWHSTAAATIPARRIEMERGGKFWTVNPSGRWWKTQPAGGFRCRMSKGNLNNREREGLCSQRKGGEEGTKFHDSFFFCFLFCLLLCCCCTCI